MTVYSSNFKFRIFEMICLCFYPPPVQICRQKNPRPDAHFSRLEFIQNNQKWATNRYLLQKAMNNADYYGTRLQDFLIAYSQDIPEYLESVGNSTQIFPDQSSTYFGGLKI